MIMQIKLWMLRFDFFEAPYGSENSKAMPCDLAPAEAKFFVPHFATRLALRRSMLILSSHYFILLL